MKRKKHCGPKQPQQQPWLVWGRRGECEYDIKKTEGSGCEEKNPPIKIAAVLYVLCCAVLLCACVQIR